MPNRPETLRQVIARYERLMAGASPEMTAVYAAEIAAIRAMLARIEAAAARVGEDDPSDPPAVDPEIEPQRPLRRPIC